MHNGYNGEMRQEGFGLLFFLFVVETIFWKFCTRSVEVILRLFGSYTTRYSRRTRFSRGGHFVFSSST